MEIGNPIRDDQGIVPYITIADPDWTGWCGLNVDAARIPVDAEFFAQYQMKDRDADTEPITNTGQFIDMDSIGHDWYRYDVHWEGFNPTKDFDGTLPCPTFLDFDVPTPTIESLSGQWFIPTRHAVALVSRFDHLESIVSQCARIDWGGGVYLNRPDDLADQFLGSKMFSSDADLQRAATTVRRAIADRMGWLYWLRAAIPQEILQRKLSTLLLNQLLVETRTEYRKRGYILRLADHWTEANIPLWLTHKLPIFYSWRLEERVLPQLVRMSPKLIANDTSEDRVTLYYLDEDDEIPDISRESWKFDDFFQYKVPEVPVQHLSFEMDAKCFIIDFRGWGRRPLPDDFCIGAYVERFYFKIENAESFTERPAVIFWRWRKKPPSPQEDMRRTEVGEMDESFIREIFKDTFAPRPGRLFDEENGMPLPIDPEIVMNTIIPFSDHRRDPPDSDSESDCSERYSDSLSDSDSMPDLEETPSLFTRLGIRRPSSARNEAPFTTVANVTSWRNEARSREEVRNWLGLRIVSDNAPRRRSPRSRSPVRRPLASGVIPRERPLTLFRQSLDKIAHYIVHDDPQLKLSPADLWNPVLLANGYLIITESRSEVRLRYFANSFGHNIRHIGPLLKVGIEKRLAFRIAVKAADLSSFTPRSVSFADRNFGNFIYGSNFVEAPLERRPMDQFAASYIARVGELLKRPHAPSFIGLGGACSWLAQRWGGDEIINRFMSGPSIQTTVFRRGASDIKDRYPKGLLWDEASGSDINLLFGYTLDPVTKSERWLYPPPHIIDEFCHNWTGEWNWIMETMYAYLTEDLLKVPCTAILRSRGGWRKWLRTYNGGSYEPVNILTEKHVADIVKGFVLAELPRTWNGRPLSSINLPETSD